MGAIWCCTQRPQACHSFAVHIYPEIHQGEWKKRKERYLFLSGEVQRVGSSLVFILLDMK